jgi:hypothetical protein
MPYISHNIEEPRKFHNINMDKSSVDFVLKVLTTCGIKDIVEVMVAKKPIIDNNIMNSFYASII